MGLTEIISNLTIYHKIGIVVGIVIFLLMTLFILLYKPKDQNVKREREETET